MSVINEPEPTGGQSSAVGVVAPIGTAKWLNSDKFIVVPPAGAWDKQGVVGSRPRQRWCELVLAGRAQSGSGRLSVPESQGCVCVLTPVGLDRPTDGLTTLNTFSNIKFPKFLFAHSGKKIKK